MLDTNLLVLIGLGLSTGLLTALFGAVQSQQENRHDDGSLPRGQ